ncbi:amino acid adenylation domain-containing protein [Dactylosporangium sp. CA-139114]|uniref:class I SAM-dependent methyltransferase n=1 Tax=Dactylosporangium sp. CA-139114 TaxID=3239931 RepID=UPI003D95ACC1
MTLPIATGTYLHHLIESQGRETPSATALISGDSRVTYAELLGRAARIAGMLRSASLQAQSVVGVHLERSSDLVAAVLGIWQAGCVYLPLDPAQPPARLEAMIRSADARHVLTDSRLGRHFARPATFLDRELGLGGLPADSWDEPAADDLAYIMFTSGSTGAPKGVMVEHRALAHQLAEARRTYIDLDARDVALQISAIGFDPSLREIFLPLMAGARVALPEPGRARDPRHLLDVIAATGVTQILGIVPSFAAELLEAARSDGRLDELHLKAAYVSGESITPLLAQGADLRHFGRLVNHYGPTECTLVTTWHPVDPDADRGRSIIGTPLPGTRVYLLDDNGAPVAPGEVGEIVIGGAGLARGYLDPVQTNARFVPDPFAGAARTAGECGQAGPRMYRTGDRGRWLPGGELEYLGRADRQLKIRGNRVEPGEVEAAIHAAAPVREVAVVGAAGGVGTRLVAYYSAADAATAADAAGLRSALRERLPGYLIPDVIVAIDRLPRTAQGKIDYLGLAALPVETQLVGRGGPPIGDRERVVCDAWKTVLGVPEVGRLDDFFELGGNSLLAMRAINQIRKNSGWEADIREIFDHPVAADYAPNLRRRSSIQPERAAGRGALREVPLALRDIQRWSARDPLAFLVPLACRFHGDLDPARLHAALTTLAARHDVLRMRLVDTPDGVRARILPDASVPFGVVDLTGASRDEVEKVLGKAQRCPIDVTADSPIRALLVREAADRHLLVLNVHHAAVDGWSYGLLCDEIGRIYRGGDVTEDPVKFDFFDYAAWQARRLEAGDLDEERAYWRDTLRDSVPLALPPDRTPEDAGPGGALVELEIDATLTDAVARAGQRSGATLFMVLAATLYRLLAQRADQPCGAIGTVAAGRTHPAFENVIGLLANTVVLNVDDAATADFPELLRRVRRSTLAALSHQDVPHGIVADELAPLRGTNRLYRTSLVLQNDPVDAIRLPGAVTEPVHFDPGVAKFDLSIWLARGDRGLRGYLEYRTDLYHRATIEQLRDDLVAGLDRAVADLAGAAGGGSGAWSNDEERYRPVYARGGSGTTLQSIWREVYGDDYSADIDPMSFVTLSDLRRFAGLLGSAAPAHLLDLGSGRGGPGLWVARELGTALTGVDISEEAVRNARERARLFGVGDATYVATSMTATGLPARSCDAAMSVDALWMVLDKPAAFREIARVLKVAAPFVFTSWQPDYLDYRELLSEAGFQTLSITETPDWKGRQLAVYEKILAHAEELRAELGAAAADVLLAEAAAVPAELERQVRVLVHAQLS